MKEKNLLIGCALLIAGILMFVFMDDIVSMLFEHGESRDKYNNYYIAVKVLSTVSSVIGFGFLIKYLKK